MKKIALLLVLTMALTFSFVYATDALANPDATEPVISGEVIDNTTVDNSGENADNANISGNVSDIESGEDINEPNTDISEDVSNVEDNNDTTTSKSTVWGAVLAIVIVVVVVALVALFSKND